MIINVTDRRGMSAYQPTQRSTGEVVKVTQGRLALLARGRARSIVSTGSRMASQGGKVPFLPIGRRYAETTTGKFRCTAPQQSNMIIHRKRPEPETTAERATEMEWEEALLRAWGGEIPQSAGYYRQKAARARQIAEGVTTGAIKPRLPDEAVHCDRLTADAERGAGEGADL